MRTLLMTADLIPLRPISTNDAITDIVQGKAYSVEDHPTKRYRSTSGFEIPAPIAIAAFRHVNLPGHFYGPAKLTNENLFMRDDGQCVYCKGRSDLTRDHVVPTSKGGKNEWPNVVTSCGTCNLKKGNKLHKTNDDGFWTWDVFDQKSGEAHEMVLMFKPKAPSKIEISRRKSFKKFRIG